MREPLRTESGGVTVLSELTANTITDSICCDDTCDSQRVLRFLSGTNALQFNSSKPFAES